jgi:hypothetical protein
MAHRFLEDGGLGIVPDFGGSVHLGFLGATYQFFEGLGATAFAADVEHAQEPAALGSAGAETSFV